MTKRTLFASLVASLLVLYVPLAAAENPYVNSTDGQACDDQIVSQIGVKEIEACAFAHIDTVVTKCGDNAAGQWECTFHFDLYLTVTGIYACGTAQVLDVIDPIGGCGVAGNPELLAANYAEKDLPRSDLDDGGGFRTFTGIVCANGPGSHTTCVSWEHVVTYPGRAQCQNGGAAAGASLGLDGVTVWLFGEDHSVPTILPSPGNWNPWAAKVQAYYDGPSPC